MLSLVLPTQNNGRSLLTLSFIVVLLGGLKASPVWSGPIQPNPYNEVGQWRLTAGAFRQEQVNRARSQGEDGASEARTSVTRTAMNSSRRSERTVAVVGGRIRKLSDQNSSHSHRYMILRRLEFVKQKCYNRTICVPGAGKGITVRDSVHPPPYCHHCPVKVVTDGNDQIPLHGHAPVRTIREARLIMKTLPC